VPAWRHIGQHYTGKQIHLVTGYVDADGNAQGFGTLPDKRAKHIWAVNGLWACIPRVSLGFEMHDLGGPSYDMLPKWYENRCLRDAKIPIFMPEDVPGWSNVHRFPLTEVMRAHNLQRPYFGESLNYCIAFAAMFKVREIIFHGFNYPASPHTVGERASTEFWCGIAKANGVKLTPDGDLMKADEWEEFYKPNQYGYRHT